jgi:TetR/AcrR family transcriptional regulator, transcriptional repressor for nem operon
MVRAAAELIHVRGVHGTSVEDILEASDTGKSQFYRYFDDKDDMVRVVLHDQMRAWMERVMPALARLDTWAGWEEWFQGILDFQRAGGFKGGCPIGSMAAEMADSNESLRIDIAEAFRMKRNYIEKGLTALKQRGDLRESVDVATLAEFLLATVQGGILVSTSQKDGAVLEHALKHALSHLRSFAANT